MFSLCVKAKCPTAFNCPELRFFDKLVVRVLGVMHISQKSFLPSYLYDLPVGHDKLLDASLYQNRIFPGQCKWWQILSSCIVRFPANLTNLRKSGGFRRFSWGACLSDWMMLKLQPSTPVHSPFPAVTTSFSHTLFLFFYIVAHASFIYLLFTVKRKD